MPRLRSNLKRGFPFQFRNAPCRVEVASLPLVRIHASQSRIPQAFIEVWSWLFASHFRLTQGAGPLGRPSPASYFTVSWYKLPGLLEYSGGWLWCWSPGRNPSVTMNAFALNDELVEVDHLLPG